MCHWSRHHRRLVTVCCASELALLEATGYSVRLLRRAIRGCLFMEEVTLMTAAVPKKPDGESGEEHFRRLMELHEQLFSEERFEAAYHVLAAALHIAEELDLERLSSVGRLSTARQAEIDRTNPGHSISSASSNRRGNTPLYATLALTARAATGKIRAAQALQRSRKPREDL